MLQNLKSVHYYTIRQNYMYISYSDLMQNLQYLNMSSIPNIKCEKVIMINKVHSCDSSSNPNGANDKKAVYQWFFKNTVTNTSVLPQMSIRNGGSAHFPSKITAAAPHKGFLLTYRIFRSPCKVNKPLMVHYHLKPFIKLKSACLHS